MPFLFLIVGVGLLVVAIRGTQATAFSLLQSEFSGLNSFVKWALALFIVGLAGYPKSIQPISRAMMALILLVIFLANGKGFFAQFNTQIANPVAPAGAGPSGGAGAGSVATPPLPATSTLSAQGQLNQQQASAIGQSFRAYFGNLLGNLTSGGQ